MRRMLLVYACLGLLVLPLGCKAPGKRGKGPASKVVTRADATKAEEFYYQGAYAYGNGDTAGAMLLWKKALALNPKHRPTLDAMAEARGKMKAVKALQEK